MRSVRRSFLLIALFVAGCAAPQQPIATAYAPTTSLPGSRPALPRESEPELECLAKTIYFEARGESERGQRAVAAVVLNRTRNPRFPNTICEVVKQGGTTSRDCQFSWWCDGRSDEPKEEAAWNRALAIAREMLAGAPDPTGGALYFHRAGMTPNWGPQLKRVAQIGAHVYYR